jgi:hypothetical protein
MSVMVVMMPLGRHLVSPNRNVPRNLPTVKVVDRNRRSNGPVAVGMELPASVTQAAIDATGLPFADAKRRADEVAEQSVNQPVCLSWFDRLENRESPANVSECHDDCELPGSVEYAISRGATLIVVVGDQDYLFCYRPLGEFA